MFVFRSDILYTLYYTTFIPICQPASCTFYLLGPNSDGNDCTIVQYLHTHNTVHSDILSLFNCLLIANKYDVIYVDVMG